MKRKFIFALATAAFVQVAAAQDVPPPPPPPTPMDQMPMDKVPPAAPSLPSEPASSVPPASSDTPATAPPPLMPPPPAAPPEPAALGAAPAIVYQASPDTAPPPAADKPYPLCSKTIKDQCRNASENGMKQDGIKKRATLKPKRRKK